MYSSRQFLILLFDAEDAASKETGYRSKLKNFWKSLFRDFPFERYVFHSNGCVIEPPVLFPVPLAVLDRAISEINGGPAKPCVPIPILDCVRPGEQQNRLFYSPFDRLCMCPFDQRATSEKWSQSVRGLWTSYLYLFDRPYLVLSI